MRIDLQDPRSRLRIYLAAAIFCFIAAFALIEIRSISRERALGFPNPNGLGYYMYLPSFALDRDLDLRNQGRISYGEEPPTWVVSGRYPIGVALTLAPSFLVAHGLSLGANALIEGDTFAPNGFTPLYQIFNLAWILAIWAGAMTLMDRVLRERFAFGGTTICGAILLFWIGSYAFWYLVRSPFWAHVLSTAWLVIALSVVDRVFVEIKQGRVTARLALLGFVMSMAVLCRLTDVFMGPFALYLAARTYQQRLIGPVARMLPLLLLSVAPVLLQLWVWDQAGAGVVPGSPEAIGYAAKERFYWEEPVLLLPLFSSLQGLFFYSPVLLWSAWGVAWGAVKRDAWRDPFFCCLGISALLLWYLNGAWYAWWFGGDAFGARAFLELGGLFIVGFAFAIEHLRTCSRHKRTAISLAVAASLLLGYGLMAARATNRMPSDTQTFLFEWERKAFEHKLLRARPELAP